MNLSIAYAPDDKYTNQTIVSIASIIHNNKSHNIDFFIMYSALSPTNLAKFKALEKGNIKLHFLKMDENIFADLPLSKWVTIQAWFRIALPDLCKNEDKILYLDCDTFVRGDLAELFAQNIEYNFLAGVKDVWGVKKHVQRLNLESNVYCNSGMLLLNCKYCREEKFFNKIIEYAHSNSSVIEFCDQDSINKIADTKKIVLHPKYNFMDTWWRGGYYEFDGKEEVEYLEAMNNPLIVHLTGLKPAFKGCNNKFKEEWWKYAEKTEVFAELRQGFEESKPPKEPLKDMIFSIKNKYSGKTKIKVLTFLGIHFTLKKISQ